MADELKMIQRDEYPEPRLFDRDGNLYAEVSVPTSLWHLFGTNAKRRLALKTNNKKFLKEDFGKKPIRFTTNLTDGSLNISTNIKTNLRKNFCE